MAQNSCNVMLLCSVLFLGLQASLFAEDPKCSIDDPFEGETEILGTVGPQVKMVRVTVTGEDVFTIEAPLIGVNQFRVAVPELKFPQDIKVQELPAGEDCSATVAPAQDEDPACDETDSIADPCHVYKNWMIMDPKNVTDVFGRRIGKRFIAVQVTVYNSSRDFNFIIHDVAVLLKKGDDFSSAELSLLRGVAARGRASDPRNKVLNLLKGAGVIFTAVLGLPVGGARGSWAAGVAGFNPLIAGFETIYPDHSINQLVRLSDGAYTANTMVPKGQARVMFAFVPQRLFMNKAHRKKFWNDPKQFWKGGGSLDLSKIEVQLDGMHVVNVAEIPPILTAVMFKPGEVEKFGTEKPEASGFFVGRFLTGATISIQNEDLDGIVTLKIQDTSTDKSIEFIVKSTKRIKSGTVLKFGVAKKGAFRTINRKIQY